MILTDVTLWFDGFDATCNTNEVNLAVGAETKDKTTFCSDGWRENLAGLRTVDFSYIGFGEFDDDLIDAIEFGNLGSSLVHTVSPDGADGSVAYSFQGLRSRYQQTVQVGEIAGVQGSAMNARQGAVRGRLLLPKQTLDEAASGTGFELGTVEAGEHLYTAIHVFGAGTTADVVVESDSADTFASATERSNTTVTTAGAVWVSRVAGEITDTHWRVRLENVTGEFTLAVAVGIQ